MDIKFEFDAANLFFDLLLNKNDLEKDEGLATAVTISLFTDRRVTPGELPTGEKDKRGWWGDAIDPTDQNLTGSKLWLLDRSKQVEDTRLAAEDYCQEALQWMIDEGIAKSLTVAASFPDRGRIRIDISITKPEGDAVNFKYDYLWVGQQDSEG